MLQIIRGDGSRVPLVDGDHIELVHGAQGGWHIEVGAALDKTERLATLDLEVETLDGLMVSHGRYSVGLADYGVDGCSGYRDNMLGIFGWRLLPNPDDLRPSELMHDLPVIVRVRATTESGMTEEEVAMVVWWPEAEP